MHNAHQRAVERDSANERLRAVNRVQYPAVAAASFLLTIFLSDDTIGGKGGGDLLSQ